MLLSGHSHPTAAFYGKTIPPLLSIHSVFCQAPTALRVFGRTTRWHLDFNRHSPGSEATLTAVTLDPLRYPDDPRLLKGFAVYPRLIHGTQLLYGTFQYGDGFVIFAGAPRHVYSASGSVPRQTSAGPGTSPMRATSGMAMHREIRSSFTNWNQLPTGPPVYNWQTPMTWPMPLGFSRVNRIIYDKSTDSLYIFGWSKGQKTYGALGNRRDDWAAVMMVGSQAILTSPGPTPHSLR